MTNGLRFESRTYMNEDSAKAIKQAWEEHKNRGEEFSADAKTAELDIYGPISNRLLKEVSGFLADVKGKDLTVRINSPGGDYYAGLSIANRLDEHKGAIHTIVDGLAASAAAVVFMAGDKRTMKPSSQLMFHPVMTIAFGNRFDMEKVIKQLKASDDAMADFLLAEGKFSMSRNELDEWLQKEEFIGVKQARKINAVTEEEEEKNEEEEEEKKVAETEEEMEKETNEEEEKKKEIEALYQTPEIENMIAERLGY